MLEPDGDTAARPGQPGGETLVLDAVQSALRLRKDLTNLVLKQLDAVARGGYRAIDWWLICALHSTSMAKAKPKVTKLVTSKALTLTLTLTLTLKSEARTLPLTLTLKSEYGSTMTTGAKAWVRVRARARARARARVRVRVRAPAYPASAFPPQSSAGTSRPCAPGEG